jgi:hypothetical protein
MITVFGEGTARATGASQPSRPLLAGSDQLIGYTQDGFRIASNAAWARNPDRVSPCLRAWASTARRGAPAASAHGSPKSL